MAEPRVSDWRFSKLASAADLGPSYHDRDRDRDSQLSDPPGRPRGRDPLAEEASLLREHIYCLLQNFEHQFQRLSSDQPPVPMSAASTPPSSANGGETDKRGGGTGPSDRRKKPEGTSKASRRKKQTAQSRKHQTVPERGDLEAGTSRVSRRNPEMNVVRRSDHFDGEFQK